tara:strand:+ start:2211 stop:2405 length:195 start_codon:yes stop_codon:yes gene_type:complete
MISSVLTVSKSATPKGVIKLVNESAANPDQKFSTGSKNSMQRLGETARIALFFLPLTRYRHGTN